MGAIHKLGVFETVVYASCPLTASRTSSVWIEKIKDMGGKSSKKSRDATQLTNDQPRSAYQIKRDVSGLAGFYANIKKGKIKKNV